MANGTGNPQSYTAAGDPTKSMESAQWWLLFGVLVANKSAEQTTEKLIKFLSVNMSGTPFEKLRYMVSTGVLRVHLEMVRTGQYTRIEKAFKAIDRWSESYSDPRTWTLQGLEGIPGIGPKTARWFYMLVHPDAKVAALDTHVLKFLRDQGEQVPKGTPATGPKYQALEAKFITWAEKLGVKPSALDFMAWTVYKNKGKILF